MAKQRPTPAWLKADLPVDPIARRRVYKARYDAWWRSQNPGYMAAYWAAYKQLGTSNHLAACKPA